MRLQANDIIDNRNDNIHYRSLDLKAITVIARNPSLRDNCFHECEVIINYETFFIDIFDLKFSDAKYEDWIGDGKMLDREGRLKRSY
jgi:hypothetical protein